jgi:hypothetical protein
MSASYDGRLSFSALGRTGQEFDFSSDVSVLLALYAKQAEYESALTQRLIAVGKQVREMSRTWTKGDVEEIGRWAHAQSATAKMERNVPDVESRIARAFESQDEESRIEALCRVPGMGPALTSSILTLTFPEKYGPLEIHAWNSLTHLGFDLPPKPSSGGGFTTSELLRYLKIIRNLAKSTNLTPWNVVKALHALDRAMINRKWGEEFSRLKSIS